MLLQRRGIHLLILSSLWLAALISGPTETAVAQQNDEAKDAQKKGIARLRGVVNDSDGKPLSGALVRIAIPETDMRFVDTMTGHKIVEAKTNENGVCFIEAPGLDKPTSASLDVLMPGYQRLVGTLMAGGDEQSVELAPNKIVTAKMVLQPALYFKGTVVDEAGKPIPNVQVSANCAMGQGAGGVERTTTNADGSFELFNYSVEPVQRGRGGVYFFHTDHLESEIADVYKIAEADRTSLRVTLAAGQQVAGTLLDVSGRPAPSRMVKVMPVDGSGRKAMLTNAEGKFLLRGLSKGDLVLSCMDFEHNQKISSPIKSDAEKKNLEVRLEAIKSPKMTKYSVLGMTLGDIDDEVQEAYELQPEAGALIVDPGTNSDRLKIGTLSAGYHFWMAGEQRIGSVREFVDTVLEEAKFQNGAEVRVRVVYSFSTVEFDGSNTQYLDLTKEDLEGLRKLQEEFEAKE